MSSPRLGHGFERKTFKVVNLELPFIGHKVSAGMSTFTDGIESLAVMEVATADLKMVEDIGNVYRDPQIWRAINQGGAPIDWMRRRAMERVQFGKTTLLGLGSINGGEIKFLVSQFGR